MTDGISAETGRLYKELKNVSIFPGHKWTEEDCANIAPLTLKINRLKKEKNAVILAHSYVRPEIIYGVADIMGDSYALSMAAKKTPQQNIIFAGVFFMAETAKILNPGKTVLIPAGRAGCTLADAMSAEDFKSFKSAYPGARAACYINSSAEIKAECDVTVTSSNVYDIVAQMPSDKVIFAPDVFMAENVKAELKKRGIEKEVFSVGGSCCVHDQYMPFHVNNLRNKYPGIKVVAHPECHKDVCALCDYVGSTSGMMNYVKNSEDTQFALLTEEGLVNRLEHDNPGKEFVWQFGRCSFMKRNSLQNILECLEKPNPMQTINLDPATAAKAAKSLEEMFRLTEGR